MPNGKTIRQIADEIGVTRQAIYKKFKLNKEIESSLKTYSFTTDRVKYYTLEGELLIKSMFTENHASQRTDNLTTTTDNQLTSCQLTGLQDNKSQINTAFSSDNSSCQPVNSAPSQVDRLTDLLIAQLTEKDHQIEEKDRQLSEKDCQLAEKDHQIAMLMEQSNNLTAALQAAQALAAADKKQLLLQTGSTTEQLESSEPPENTKKGLFSRIFRK